MPISSAMCCTLSISVSSGERGAWIATKRTPGYSSRKDCTFSVYQNLYSFIVSSTQDKKSPKSEQVSEPLLPIDPARYHAATRLHHRMREEVLQPSSPLLLLLRFCTDFAKQMFRLRSNVIITLCQILPYRNCLRNALSLIKRKSKRSLPFTVARFKLTGLLIVFN